MADTAHSNQFFSFINRVFKVLRTIHRQRRGKFFVGKRLAFINVGDFTNQNLGGHRNGEACQLSDFIRRLTNDSGVQRAIFQNDILNRFQLLALQQVAAVAGETFANGVVYGIYNDYGLLGSTNNAVIEGFRHQYGCDGAFDISRFVDNNGSVTRAYADCRFTRAVRCFNHARTAGSEDQVDIRVMHQRIGQFYGRLVNPTNQIFRRAGSDSRLQYDISCFIGCIFSTRMRGEDDGVTSLQANQRFKDSG
ncbi:Uncharacterised protein [Klebsiella oxytoca]|nr:Uncharacterised protein [Klebsiella oxytoca]SAQ16480.1 Uncharacterised protein [Klebsiella oxytoca]